MSFRPIRNPQSAIRNEGTAVIVSLVVLALLSMMAVSFARLMRLEVDAAQNWLDAGKTDEFARRALNEAIHYIREDLYDAAAADGSVNNQQTLRSPWALGGGVFGTDFAAALDGANENHLDGENYDDALPPSDYLAASDGLAPATARQGLWKTGSAYKLDTLDASREFGGQVWVYCRDTSSLISLNLWPGALSENATRMSQAYDALPYVDATMAASIQDGRLAGGGAAGVSSPGDGRPYFATSELRRVLNLTDTQANNLTWNRLKKYFTAHPYADPDTWRPLVNINTAPPEVLWAILAPCWLADGQDPYGAALGEINAVVSKILEWRKGQTWTDGALTRYAFYDVDQFEQMIATLAPDNPQDDADFGIVGTGAISERTANNLLNQMIHFYGGNGGSEDDWSNDANRNAKFVPPPDGEWTGGTATPEPGFSRFANVGNLGAGTGHYYATKTGGAAVPRRVYLYDWDNSAFNAGDSAAVKRQKRYTEGEVAAVFASGGALEADLPATVEFCTRSRIFDVHVISQVGVKTSSASLIQDLYADRRLEAVFDASTRKFLSYRWVTEATGGLESYAGVGDVSDQTEFKKHYWPDTPGWVKWW